MGQTGTAGTPYAPTRDFQHQLVTQMSISAMPAYANKSHEELRWEDVQAGRLTATQARPEAGGRGSG